MTPALPRWADIPITKTGISPSQVKALPPAHTALDLAELFQHVRAVRCGFMGEREGKGRRIQAEGLKHCSLCCVSCGRGMSSPLLPPKAVVSRGVLARWLCHQPAATGWLPAEKMEVPSGASGVLTLVLFACLIFCKAELFWFLTLLRKLNTKKI